MRKEEGNLNMVKKRAVRNTTDGGGSGGGAIDGKRGETGGDKEGFRTMRRIVRGGD